MGPLSTTAFLVSSAIKVIGVFTVLMTVVALITLAERRVSAWIQDRSGPNRVGPFGLFQPLADGLKNLTKEENMPGAASKGLFIAAPMIAIFPALVLFAVIPFGAPLPTRWGLVPMIIADLPVGFLYIVALASLGVYGIVLGGWSSNSKYAMLGGLRASAQMISYEIGFGLSLVPILMLSGNVSLPEIVSRQQEGFWFILPLMLGYFFYIASAFAETNRLPFDMPEAESELVTGYHTEYSSMKFSMFFIAEYANVLTQSALMATFFFGGWDIPFTTWDNVGVVAPDGAVMGAAPSVLKTLATMGAFAAKTGFFVFAFIWVRWTLPRFRYDQVQSLGWKVIIPLLVAYIAIMGGAMIALQSTALQEREYLLALTGINVVMLLLLGFGVDRGRIIAGSSWDARRRTRLRALGAGGDDGTSRGTTAVEV